MIAISYSKAEFASATQGLLAQAKKPRAVLLGMGREAANVLKKHFRKKDMREPNALAPDRRQHFWLQVAGGVQAPVMPDPKSVEVSINHPAIAQKVFGGTIVAKRVRNLAIPIAPEAYGRTPATFEHETGLKLFLLKSVKGRQPILAVDRGNKRIEVEYLLTPRVKQKPDPTALPDPDELVAAMVKRGQRIVDRQLADQPGGSLGGAT